MALSSADSPSATCLQGKLWVTKQLLYSRTPLPQRRDQALGISPNLSQILQMIRQSFDQTLQMLRTMEQLLHQHCRLLYRLLRLLKPKEATGNLGLAPHCWQVATPCSCPPPLPPRGRGSVHTKRSTCRQHAGFDVASTTVRHFCLCWACLPPTCCKLLLLPLFAVAAELLFVPMLVARNPCL